MSLNIRKTLEAALATLEKEPKDQTWTMANEHTNAVKEALRQALRSRIASGRLEPTTTCEVCAHTGRTATPCEHDLIADLIQAGGAVIQARADGTFGPDGDHGFKTLERTILEAGNVAVRLGLA